MSDPVGPGHPGSSSSRPHHQAPAPPPPAATRPDPPAPVSQEDEAPDAGVLATAVGVVVSPRVTLRAVTARPRIGGALGVAVAVLALTSIGNAADSGMRGGGPFGGDAAFVAGAVTGLLVGLGMLALAAVIILGVARLLGGSGSYAATFCGMAYAVVPWVLTVPLSLLGTAAGFPGQLVAGVLSVVVGVWATALTVLAVGTAQGLTTGRALAAVGAPVLVLAALIGLPFAIVLLIFFIALAAA